MNRTVVVAVLCAIVGGLVGSGISRAVAQRHQHTHAVMWLAQIHLTRLDLAAQARSCQSLDLELESLRYLRGELVRAFPLVYQQDGEFRRRADALASALRAGTTGDADCSAAMRQAKPIREACDACHREYR